MGDALCCFKLYCAYLLRPLVMISVMMSSPLSFRSNMRAPKRKHPYRSSASIGVMVLPDLKCCSMSVHCDAADGDVSVISWLKKM